MDTCSDPPSNSNDELSDARTSGSGFSWPPPMETGRATEVVDLDADQITSLDEAASAAASPENAFGSRMAVPSSAPAPTPTRHAVHHPPGTRRLGPLVARFAVPFGSSRVLISVLALLAVAQGIVIAMQVTRGDLITSLLPKDGDRIVTGFDDPSTTVPKDVVLPASAGPPAAAAVTPAAAPTGELHVRAEPPGAAVLLDGHRRGTSPLTLKTLAPGRYRIRLTSGERSVDETVTVQSGVTTSLVVRMPSATIPEAGWVDIVTPFEVHIFEKSRFVGTSSQLRLQFPAGEHTFELANTSLGFRVQERVQVRGGQVATVRPNIPNGLLNINALPWAEVWIDGRPAGTTPLGNVQVSLGPHEIRFRHPQLGEQTRQVVVTASETARVGLEFGR